ncbi:MAG TPA: hypothetical protein VK762_22385 [Polyangiaceae bacterium]|nr:hypothetical protein [Polyangiaceae bacterium]
MRWLPLALLATIHCGKGATSAPTASTTSTAASGSTEARPVEAGADDDAGTMDARESEAWARAQDGGDDGDDLRLADLVGCTGLRERAGDARLRRTAVRAMAQCQDFSELPWLADLGARGSDAEALEALDAIVAQSARVRRATDPEDADELHEGCAELLTLARTAAQSAPRRVRAIRALRMLSERGCVKRADIPADLDAK